MELKIRDAGYCNLKLFLMLLVIYGHTIEQRIQESEGLMLQYRLIYTFHMPAFVFLSGMFLSGGEACRRQALRALKYYLAIQGCVAFVDITVLGEGASLWTPCWHLWYLLSLSCWAGVCFLAHRGAAYLFRGEGKGHFVGRLAVGRGGKLCLIGLSVLPGCLAGCFPGVGRWLSLSRTIVFFPYFLAGYFCPVGIRWKKGRVQGIFAGLLGIALFLAWGKGLSAEFLYQADGYGAMAPGRGICLRLFCYLLGGLFTFSLLTCMPERKFRFSRAGADTLGIFLCHAPLALFAGRLPVSLNQFAAIAPLLAGAEALFLYELLRFQSPLFVLVGSGRARGKDYGKLFRSSRGCAFQKSLGGIQGRRVKDRYAAGELCRLAAGRSTDLPGKYADDRR